MNKRQFTPEEMIGILRKADAKLAGGRTLGQICRELGITEESYYRCRIACMEMKAARVKWRNNLQRGKIPSVEPAADPPVGGPISKRPFDGRG